MTPAAASPGAEGAGLLLEHCFIGFLLGFLGSVPITGPISALVFQDGMRRRWSHGFSVGLGSGVVEGGFAAGARPAAAAAVPLPASRFCPPLPVGRGLSAGPADLFAAALQWLCSACRSCSAGTLPQLLGRRPGHSCSGE